jgi:hypothetical protein
LFIMVAESTEILRPITQLGCAHACSGVTAARLSSGAARNGPPEAVRTIAVDGEQLRARLARHAHHERPGHDQRFLVGEQHALAGAGGGEGRGQPGGAHDAGHHRMAIRMRYDLVDGGVAFQKFGSHTGKRLL